MVLWVLECVFKPGFVVGGMKVLRGTIRKGPVPVVLAVILNEGQVLLGKRKAGFKGVDGKWELPGGKIRHGESPEEAIIREVREECGLEVLPIGLVGAYSSVISMPGGVKYHALVLGYSCEIIHGSVKKSGAHHDMDWFSTSSLPDPFFSGTDVLVEAALKYNPSLPPEPEPIPTADATESSDFVWPF